MSQLATSSISNIPIIIWVSATSCMTSEQINLWQAWPELGPCLTLNHTGSMTLNHMVDLENTWLTAWLMVNYMLENIFDETTWLTYGFVEYIFNHTVSSNIFQPYGFVKYIFNHMVSSNIFQLYGFVEYIISHMVNHQPYV